ncbi:hypothetical protein [Vibrio genomosp. F10]|uniref:hypothetical protein n=1 Tax=Vibrio genomosp. F10 TaxID=723171 RepID=UPI00036EBFF6|nr:hypothetical protein [Vibrio genomosp. F10]OEE82077.1 hypothetical protein A1QK_04440 [Vibrio genomosp. F10 str. 9ZD137]
MMNKFVVRDLDGYQIAIDTHNNNCFEINEIVFDLLDRKSRCADYVAYISLKYEISEEEVKKLEVDIMEALDGS